MHSILQWFCLDFDNGSVSGVPQSLFASRSYFHFYKMTFLLINDPPSLFTCACLLYVDNIKLFSAVDSRAPQTSAYYLCDVLRISTNTLSTNFQQTLYFVLLVQNFRPDTYLLLSWPTLKNDSLTRKLRGGRLIASFILTSIMLTSSGELPKYFALPFVLRISSSIYIPRSSSLILLSAIFSSMFPFPFHNCDCHAIRVFNGSLLVLSWSKIYFPTRLILIA